MMDWQFLWAQSTGGSNVAINLGGVGKSDPPVSFLGPSAPGVDAASSWLQDALQDPSLHRMLFLVGGPGSGKSHTARDIVQGLSEIDRLDDGLAHRAHRYETAANNLLVINDATIGSGADADGALGSDIASAISNNWNFLACVNRGVIVDELGASNSDRGSLENEILYWLSEGGEERLPIAGITFDRILDADYLRYGRIRKSDGGEIEVACVLMDVCSLFEERPVISPAAETGRFQDLTLGKYSVSPFDKRRSMNADSVPGVVLLRRVMEETLPYMNNSVEPEWNPFYANHESLKTLEVSANLCSLLRAAEIVSSKRFTYRELWGVIVRSILGSATDETDPSGLLGWVNGLQKEVEEAPNAIKKFEAMKKLASFRFSQAIFGVDELSGATNPVCRLLAPVDPLRDATPGKRTFGDPRQSDLWGWATPVTDAFAGGETAATPLENLLAEVSDKHDLIHKTVTAFDRNLDRLFMEAKSSEGLKDRHRDEMVSWYGSYLLRLYGVSNGIPAFEREVAQWTLIWFTQPSVPTFLEAPLKTLLLPSRDPASQHSSYLLPLFDSRTLPIQLGATDPRLAVLGGDFDLEIRTSGDKAQVVLSKAGDMKGVIECDFPLVREALSCNEGHLGMTEFTHTASPRLERLRSLQLTAEQLSHGKFRVVAQSGETIIKVGQ